MKEEEEYLMPQSVTINIQVAECEPYAVLRMGGNGYLMARTLNILLAVGQPDATPIIIFFVDFRPNCTGPSK